MFYVYVSMYALKQTYIGSLGEFNKVSGSNVRCVSTAAANRSFYLNMASENKEKSPFSYPPSCPSSCLSSYPSSSYPCRCQKRKKRRSKRRTNCLKRKSWSPEIHKQQKSTHIFKFHWFVIFELYLIRNWQCVNDVDEQLEGDELGSYQRTNSIFLFIAASS